MTIGIKPSHAIDWSVHAFDSCNQSFASNDKSIVSIA